MKGLKALVVALVLWLPAASFADAALSHVRVDEAASSCERFADGEAEQAIHAAPAAVPSGLLAHAIDPEDVSFRGQHRVEPLLPPPNTAALI